MYEIEIDKVKDMKKLKKISKYDQIRRGCSLWVE